MRVSRRQFVAAGGAAAVLGTWSCGSSSGGGGARSTATFERKLIDRAGYGPLPGDLEAVARDGAAQWLERQLDPNALVDDATQRKVDALETYGLSRDELRDRSHVDIQLDLGRASTLRALATTRQLQETMVEFWSDHFHMFLGKLPYLARLRVIYDRNVLRPLALGRVADLAQATARSPAMLVSLDNVLNVAGNPNENYARELMELHTLGVDAGYTQTDVEEMARALTGWSIDTKDRFAFDEATHDDGSKTVYGQFVPGSDTREVEWLIDHFTQSPAAARFIATKLVRRFVADEPPTSLIDSVASVYLESGGDVRSLVRRVFTSDEFKQSPRKLKRPFHYAVSSLRALGATDADADLVLTQSASMGQPLFFWPRPDGFPDISEPWSAGLLPRWNWCLTMLDGTQAAVEAALRRRWSGFGSPATAIDDLARDLLGRGLDPTARAALHAFVGDGNPTDDGPVDRLRDAAALLLAHPEFQWS